MNAYIYQAALLCEDCANAVKANFPDWSIDDRRHSDSDQYPDGPYADGGGEADCPQHCDHCGEFLENSLTTDGMEYVRQAVVAGGLGARMVWAPFYGINTDTEEDENA